MPNPNPINSPTTIHAGASFDPSKSARLKLSRYIESLSYFAAIEDPATPIEWRKLPNQLECQELLDNNLISGSRIRSSKNGGDFVIESPKITLKGSEKLNGLCDKRWRSSCWGQVFSNTVRLGWIIISAVVGALAALYVAS